MLPVWCWRTAARTFGARDQTLRLILRPAPNCAAQGHASEITAIALADGRRVLLDHGPHARLWDCETTPSCAGSGTSTA